MDLGRKVEIAIMAINSISQHDDEDMAVREAILTTVEEHMQAEIQHMRDRVADRLGVLRKQPAPSNHKAAPKA